MIQRGKMIQAGNELPDFDARTLDGEAVNYRRDLWQRKLVVLVCFASPAAAAAGTYRAELRRRMRDLSAHDTAVLLLESVRGAAPDDTMPLPGLVLADRWGEARFVAAPEDESGLPPVDDVLEWLRFVQAECPECQGETR